MSKQSWYGGNNEALPIRSNEWKRKTMYGGPSVSLLITFLLGVAVGFFLHYALFEIRQGKSSEETTSVPVATPAAPETPESPVEQPSQEVAITASPVDPESTWPARHLIIGIPGTSLDMDTADLLNQYKPAGVWLRESNTVNTIQIRELIQQINVLAAMGPELDMQPLILAAQEGGEDLNPLRLPEALTYEDIAKLETLDAIREAGKTVAQQSRSLGVGVLLAPVLDIFDGEQRDASERPHFLGDTPETVSQAGVAYAEGLLEGGVLAVARNYPGIGSAIMQDEDVPLIPETNVEKLASTMMPFLEAAAYDISGILISSASVPALDVQVPGRPASLSPVLVREVFRNKWGYAGVLLADDIHTVYPWSGKPVEEDIIAALAAGCDAVLISVVNEEDMARIVAALKQALNDGALDAESLLASRQRLDLWRSKLARTSTGVAPETAAEPVVEGEPAVPVEEANIPAETVTIEATPAPEGEAKAEGEVEGEVVAEPPNKPEEKTEATAEPETAPEQEQKPPEGENSAEPVKPPKPATDETIAAPEGSNKVEHRIKQGDTLTGIAKHYGVSVKDIMSWNKLSDADIKFGRTLVIYSTQGDISAAPAETPVSEPQETAPPVETPSETPGTSEAPVPEAPPTLPEEPVTKTTVSEPIPPVQETPVTPQEEPARETYVPEQIPPAPEAPAAPPEEPALDTYVPEQVPPAPEMSVPEPPETPIAPEPADAQNETPSVSPGGEEPAVTKNFSMRSSTPKKVEADDSEDVVPPPEAPDETPEKTSAAPEMSVTVVPVEQAVTIEPAVTVAPAAETTASSEPAPEPETVSAPSTSEKEYTTYVIKSGDNLSRVANKYGVTVKELMDLNAIDNADIVVLGTELKVPKL